MKPTETPSDGQTPRTRGGKAESSGSNHDRYRFTQAVDSRKRIVPGLWIRNGRYYALLWVEQHGKKTSRRFPLEARNLTEAKDALDRMRQKRREEKLPSAGRKPLLADYIKTYLESPLRRRRRANTQYKDQAALARFLAFAGNVRVDRITPAMIRGFTEKRLATGTSARTVNLDLITLRGLLKRAAEDELLTTPPRVKALRAEPARKRDLLTPEQFQRLLTEARNCSKNGEQLADLLQLLAFSGCREQEALRLKWEDVDFTARRLRIGADGLSKNGEMRFLEFNPQLEAHLGDMANRRDPDSSWLFPSPMRGNEDRRALTLRPSFKIARARIGLPHLGFHDLRHYFASLCVMNGIDFMTIAAWLGHKDGGILVGKVYGHLLDEHRRKEADRLRFHLGTAPSHAKI